VTSSVSIPFPNTVRLHALASTLGEALFVQNTRPFQVSVRAPEEETVGCGFCQDTLGTYVRQKCIGKKQATGYFEISKRGRVACHWLGRCVRN